jgi:fimbrial chaperone protein
MIGFRLKKHALSLAAALVMSAASLSAMASSFRLQSPTVVLNEADGRTPFTITNTGNEPILLLTKVEDLGDQTLAKDVLVTPAVTRIEPGESQFVNFTLKKGVKLDHEYLLKASFEGVTQRAEHGTRMTVRQEVGFIAQPKSVPVEAAPWKDLQVKVSGDQLTFTNPGKHVVRLAPSVTLEPSSASVGLPHAYIMPGESVSVTDQAAASAQSISITPLSRYGLVQDKGLLPVAR